MERLPARNDKESRLPAIKPANVVKRLGYATGMVGFASAGVYALTALEYTVVGIILLCLGAISMIGYQFTRTLEEEDFIGKSSHVSEDEPKRSLGRCRFLEHIGNRGERAYDQYTQATVRHKKLMAVLDEKFNPDEITYGRYHGAIGQAHLGLMGNFENLANHLQAAAATDPLDISKRLKELTAAATAPNDEQTALQERLRIREAELAKADEIIGFNEKALLELDRITSALSAIKTRRDGSGAVDLSTALADLEELSKRAQKYSIK